MASISSCISDRNLCRQSPLAPIQLNKASKVTAHMQAACSNNLLETLITNAAFLPPSLPASMHNPNLQLP
eukprot:14742487-Ditylum_brightwellii.AAC.1